MVNILTASIAAVCEAELCFGSLSVRASAYVVKFPSWMYDRVPPTLHSDRR